MTENSSRLRMVISTSQTTTMSSLGKGTMSFYHQHGFDVDFQMLIDRGIKVFPFTFPITFEVENPLDLNFVVFVRFLNATAPAAAGFPFTFPIIFADAGLNIVQCLFNKLKPVDVKLVFEFLGTPKPVFPFTFPLKFAAGPFDVDC